MLFRSSSQIPLNSIDNDDSLGTKSIFIKISSHEVIVIESRRNGYWSSGLGGNYGFPPKLEGLLVYKVDTSIDVNRVSDLGGFAVLQLMPGTKLGNYSRQNLSSFLVKQGQTLETSGIAISLVKSGTFDSVRQQEQALHTSQFQSFVSAD